MGKDVRLRQLAENVLKHSVKLKKGEKIYIEAFGDSTKDLLGEFIAVAAKLGGVPFYFHNDNLFVKSLIENSDAGQMKAYAEYHANLMRQADCYIGLRGYDDVFSLSDVSDKKMALFQKYVQDEIHRKIRVPHTRWCVMRYPNQSMAVMSRMSLQAFEDFYFGACLLDYSKMKKAMQPLKKLMDKTKKVRIKAPGTDLSFSIEGIKSIMCFGEVNIPDGEVYTAPVKNSINGVIQFNTDTVYDGEYFSNIRLEFKDGKIVNGTSAANNDKFQKMLNFDEGSRYMGEFALGVNPFVTKPIMDILFDEKICGSLHLAIGNSYEDETNNGNVSSIHWDLVMIQRPEWGGGEIWFDDVLIRKDGKFVLKELQGLNPENLK